MPGPFSRPFPAITLAFVVVLAVGALVLAGCGQVSEVRPAASPAPAATGKGATAEPTQWIVTNVVDGDTVDVEFDGTTERIRMRGIDTPERGDCGYDEATNALALTAGGKAVSLDGDERDRYGRLVAYVDVIGGPDAGITLIEQGLAIARYDSRDGYGSHPREAGYVAADAASPVAGGCLSPSASAEPSQVASAPPAAPEGVVYANCDAARAAGVAPLREADPGYSRKLDRDGDGVACT